GLLSDGLLSAAAVAEFPILDCMVEAGLPVAGVVRAAAGLVRAAAGAGVAVAGRGALSIAGAGMCITCLRPERHAVGEQAGKRAEFGGAEQAGFALELAGNAAYDVAHADGGAVAVGGGEGGGTGGGSDGGAGHVQAGQHVEVHVGGERSLDGEYQSPQLAPLGCAGAGEVDDEVEAAGGDRAGRFFFVSFLAFPTLPLLPPLSVLLP